jgi:hypothetical protein
MNAGIFLFLLLTVLASVFLVFSRTSYGKKIFHIDSSVDS